MIIFLKVLILGGNTPKYFQMEGHDALRVL